MPTILEWEIGKKERPTPQDLLGSNKKEKQLCSLEEIPLPPQLEDIKAEVRENGILVKIASLKGERYYGLGLQLYSFLQNGKRKRLCINADAVADTGDSHASVPFFLSSQGYGILIDSAAVVEVDFGGSARLEKKEPGELTYTEKTTTEELYEERQRSKDVSIYVRGTRYLRLYCFASGSIMKAVEQYNLFCGGGCLPPLWGLGNLYRCYTAADQQQVEAMIKQLKKDEMPVSMIGLEPGWHSHSYSCSFQWDSKRFPEPERLIRLAEDSRMKVNLWEQAFVHPQAPFYEEICKFSGDHEVWEGAVPDFACKEAVEIYAKHQKKLFTQGISAVKLDECDGSDFTGSWFFPDYTSFPSGLTGEEEKNLFGAMAIRAVQKGFDWLGKRTWSQVRANYSYGAPMPYVLYSDLYDHRQFVRALCNSGLSGLLWSPEVRQCGSREELLRRLQTVIFSPLSLVNAWMIPNAPWKQFDILKNKEGELLEDTTLQDQVRELFQLRNRLVPYFYSAFYRYMDTGTPPFRPLIMDFAEDENVWETDDCYMAGDSLLIAPVFGDGEMGWKGREVYLPEGVWYDFWTDSRLEGGCKYRIETDHIPVFVWDSCFLPLAEEKEAPGADSVFHLQVSVYGEKPKPFLLVEDDGESIAPVDRRCLYIRKGQKGWEIPESRRYVITDVLKKS